MKYFRKTINASKPPKWYSLHLQYNIFGGFDVICRWGVLNNPRRNERVEPFPTEHEAVKRLELLSLQRISRGFSLISPIKAAA